MPTDESVTSIAEQLNREVDRNVRLANIDNRIGWLNAYGRSLNRVMVVYGVLVVALIACFLCGFIFAGALLSSALVSAVITWSICSKPLDPVANEEWPKS